MSTAPHTLDVSNGEGGNTRIHYVMSSGGRKLKEADIVLEGRLSSEDIDTIRDHLAANEGFRPDTVCMPDLVELMPLSWTPTGDERHDIVKIGYTNSKPTAGSVDAEHFASGFQTFDYRAALTM
ncbi:hypothetical protein GOB57_24735 [Sinorhizobium meliloti]|nr:hypothetical protein [Sinorhizobium meliloti]